MEAELLKIIQDSIAIIRGALDISGDENFVEIVVNADDTIRRKRRRVDQEAPSTRMRLASNDEDDECVIVYEKQRPVIRASSNKTEESSNLPGGGDSQKTPTNVMSCPVCFTTKTELPPGGNFVATLCGHVLCNACIQRIMRSKKQCPTCRLKLNSLENRILYL